MYFPVFVEGANLSMGDMHFSQGDGEVSFCGAIGERSPVRDLQLIRTHIHTCPSRGGMLRLAVVSPAIGIARVVAGLERARNCNPPRC